MNRMCNFSLIIYGLWNYGVVSFLICKVIFVVNEGDVCIKN